MYTLEHVEGPQTVSFTTTHEEALWSHVRPPEPTTDRWLNYTEPVIRALTGLWVEGVETKIGAPYHQMRLQRSLELYGRFYTGFGPLETDPKTLDRAKNWLTFQTKPSHSLHKQSWWYFDILKTFTVKDIYWDQGENVQRLYGWAREEYRELNDLPRKIGWLKDSLWSWIP